ncbi:hypothetical protein CAPTEDRAFT_228394 [Capitella teleta]|uniref:Uncharacterized protein n=1 Tax=Capitella teleta TaxID=283909 RepID=R7UZ63_CAPTE|nr:hypothetical protein CAPTEDRAFT_228394 [Capitella teleta]|eukprot:ELU11557.1 hypothetical protein CAPTEDRAFT_228394 [Capitella teleta]
MATGAVYSRSLKTFLKELYLREDFDSRSTSLQQDVTNTVWEEEEEEEEGEEEEKKKEETEEEKAVALAEEETIGTSIAGLDEIDFDDMEKTMRIQCLGGWGFLLVALGIFFLVPGSVLAGYFASRPGDTLQIVSLTLVGAAVLFLLLGIAFSVYWCFEYKTPKKADEEAGAQECLTTLLQFRSHIRSDRGPIRASGGHIKHIAGNIQSDGGYILADARSLDNKEEACDCWIATCSRLLCRSPDGAVQFSLPFAIAIVLMYALVKSPEFVRFLLFYHSIWKSSIPLKFMDSFFEKALIRRVRERIWKIKMPKATKKLQEMGHDFFEWLRERVIGAACS